MASAMAKKTGTVIFFRPTPQSTPADENLSDMQKSHLAKLNTKDVKTTDEQIKKMVNIKDRNSWNN